MNAFKKEKDEARDVLLRVGQKLFADRGFDGVTTREIAAEAKLNISLISYYFKGKDGLYSAILENIGHQFEGLLGSHLTHVDLRKLEQSQFIQIMQKIILAVVQQSIENPQLVKLLAREHIEGLPRIKKVHEDVFDRLGETMVSFLEAAKTQGFLNKNIHPHVFFLLLHQSIDGYLVLRQCKTKFNKKTLPLEKSSDVEQFVEQLMLVFFSGALKR